MRTAVANDFLSRKLKPWIATDTAGRTRAVAPSLDAASGHAGQCMNRVAFDLYIETQLAPTLQPVTW